MSIVLNLGRSLFSKSSSLSSFGVVLKCPNRSLSNLTTFKLAKQKTGCNILSCYGLRNNSCLKSPLLYNKQFTNANSFCPIRMEQPVRCSVSIPDGSSSPEPQLSNKDKLKRAVKEYGATVIIFHVTISLFSLGVAYLAVTSGIDIPGLLVKIGLRNENTESLTSGTNMLGTTGDVAADVSTFVVAYAVHKVFAPVRISITLICTPFIVRHLRKIGILKPPKPSGM